MYSLTQHLIRNIFLIYYCNSLSLLSSRHHLSYDDKSKGYDGRLSELFCEVLCNTPDTRSRNRRQKPAPENWRRFLERLSYNVAPDFSGVG